jgi:chitodextrinase
MNTRQLLGELLLQAGQIDQQQLDQAIAEHSQTGLRIGQVFRRRGLLSASQLDSILHYQSNPLKLGQLLLTSGEITQQQLDECLTLQKISGKKLGEVLVDSGLVKSEKIDKTLTVQKALVSMALVTILSTSIAEAQTVQLAWDPNSEQDLAGYNVYYAPYSSQLVAGTTINVGKVVTATVPNLDPYTAYQFAVTAYNTSGLESEFSNVVTVDAQPLPADTIPPVVGITSPSTGIKVKGTVAIQVDATDNTGISKIEILDGTTLLYASNLLPYSFNWDTTKVNEGTHVVWVKAYDLQGNMSQTSTIITVYNVPILPAAIAGIRMLAN